MSTFLRLRLSVVLRASFGTVSGEGFSCAPLRSNVVLGFAAIAVAMMLPVFCGVTHMEFLPGLFSVSLCVVSVVGHLSSEHLVFPDSWCACVPVDAGILFSAPWCGHSHLQVHD